MQKSELIERQSMSLRDKIDLTTERIEKWYDYWGGKVYVAFSGGKDSTVLLNIARSVFPEIPAVFCDTGLEYPEIRKFVKSFDNITILRPKLSFKQVIEKYGYPVISKEQSQYIYQARTTKSSKLLNTRLNGNKSGQGKIREKWKFLLDAPFSISNKCCYVLKKSPAIIYEKKTGNKAIVGNLADESSLRLTTYLRYGCNMYNNSRPISAPLSFWKESDILEYIYLRNLPICSVYGDIKVSDTGFYNTGLDRTGCIWCMFGVQNDEYPNRFQRLKQTHPKLHEYCMKELEIKKVLDYMGIDSE